MFLTRFFTQLSRYPVICSKLAAFQMRLVYHNESAMDLLQYKSHFEAQIVAES